MRRVVVALLILLCAVGPAFAAPRLDLAARAGRVTVLAEPGLDGTARELAEGAEQTLTRIARDLADLPTPRAIEVHLVRDARDLPAVAPAGRGAPRYAIGVAYPDLGIVSVALRRDATRLDAAQTLRHELAHIALGVALGDRAPRWLHEGFAYQHSAEWSPERVETLAGMAWLGGVIPIEQLEAVFPDQESPANRAYAESYDFVGFLSRRGRWEDSSDDGDRAPFRRFLSELGHGADLDTAATRAYGRPLHWLFEEWKEDLSSRYRLAPLGLLGIVAWVLCAALVMLAWWRRRRINKKRIAQWDLEESAQRARRDAEAHDGRVIAPPYIPWPGEDPLDEEPDDDRPPPPLLN
jgi:hypothetical protein